MRNIIVIIALLILVAIGVVAFQKSNKNSNTTNTTSTSTSSPSPVAQPSPAESTQTSNSVTISNFAFSPANLTVKKGTTVTWTNQDSTAHTVTETDGQKGPDSSSLGNGKTYSFTFDTVGTFKYKCSIHPEMLGTVTVTE
jgi:plastocyanin